MPTSISWAEETWNPLTGCTRVSEGCRNCYAERLSARMATNPAIEKYRGMAEFTPEGPRWSGAVEFHPHVLDQPLRWRKPRRVFVCSMSDLFHVGIAARDLAAIFGAMSASPQHVFQVLTKRPAEARGWFDWVEQERKRVAAELVKLGGAWPQAGGPSTQAVLCEYMLRDLYEVEHEYGTLPPWPLPNVWLGTSVEDQATADERIPQLLTIPAATRFISYEPALGPVDLDEYLVSLGTVHESKPPTIRPGLDWVIAGGESGPGHRTAEPGWFEEVAEQCSAAGVAFFMKQDSGYRPGRQGRLPDELWQRKEYPA